MGHVTKFWSWASRCSDSVKLQQLAKRAGGWAGLSAVDRDGLLELGVCSGQVRHWSAARPWHTRGRVVTLADPDYPTRLRRISHPPAVLCVEGRLGAIANRAVAVVGARRCTGRGRAVARHLGHALASFGVCVVSGLARGIDTEAHRGGLLDGNTVAVLAHGLSFTSPTSNRYLRRQILDRGGCVLTAFADDRPPRPHTFPVRNRWVAGLSDAVVVVEAAARSGTMHTVRAALDEGRDVFAVPGQLGQSTSEGCLRLIEQGAGVIVDVDEFAARMTGSESRPPDGWLGDVLRGVPLEAVARRSNLTIRDLLTRLGRLELHGRLVRLPGGRYAKQGRWE